jgi:nucleoside-diphosphate-sugar epimerase
VAERLQHMLFISSSMVFESATRFPSKEEDLRVIPPPFTAYGFSKLIGEWYCRAFHDQHGLPYTILRPFNAIGPEEAAGDEVGDAHVIPDLVKKIRGGQYPIELLGDGSQTRCFTHVTDIARGIVMALDHPAAVNEDFNLGNEEEITMLELARRIYAAWGGDQPFKATFVPGFPSDVKRRVPDGSKAKRLLGWEPQIDFATGLREVIGKA